MAMLEVSEDLIILALKGMGGSSFAPLDLSLRLGTLGWMHSADRVSLT